MVKALRDRPGVIRLVLGLLALVLAVSAFAVTSAQSASAADATPSPTATDEVTSQSIGVWVRIADDKSNVAGVTVKVTGPKGFAKSVVTGDDGRATVPVPIRGTYTAVVDTASLPAGKGQVLGENLRKIQVDEGNEGVPAYYLLGTGNATPTPGSSGTPSSGSGDATSPAEVILPRLATGLIFGLLLALASIGVSLIYGTTGLNNFAHGELVTFGGLVGYIFAGPLGFPAWFGIIAALLAGGLFGYLQDLGLWKPLRKKGVGLIPLMIVSIGLSLVLRYLYQFLFGPGLLVTPSDSSAFLTLGPVHLRLFDVISPIICIVAILAVAFMLTRTRIGKATRAVADNRSLAAATGINVERVIRIVWIGAGALAGLSGALIGYYQPVNWETGASILLLIFAAVTLGGLGTTFGALVGSLVIGLLVDLSTIFIPSNMKFVAALAVMIVILIFRPQGILGRRDRIG